MNKKIVFFFGAGAECSAFGLPSGAEYTLETMCKKRTELYNELNAFYQSRLPKEYVEKYRADFMFSKTSHTFHEIVRNAAVKASTEQNENDIDEDTKKLAKNIERQKKAKEEKDSETEELMEEAIKNACQEAYEEIVSDPVDSKNKSKQTENKGNKSYQSIKENMEYYGAVEKDFSTIINPKEAGPVRFWRLINYFWSAYFVIFKGVCRGIFCDKKQDKDCYKCVLADLEKAVHKIYNEYDYLKVDLQNDNYYVKIKNEFRDCVAITTNYTPFVEHYFNDKSIYLSGKLCEFEYPCELSVKNIRDTKINDNDFIFPFLMTQAPVKPIISQSQIEAYWRAISALRDADVLVVIGYSLCKEDNHINALLREAVLSKKLKFIYCDYASSKERFDYEVSKDNILNRLKLNVNTADAKEAAENVVLLENTGDVDALIKKICKIIQVI